jgi:hypothetical protein
MPIKFKPDLAFPPPKDLDPDLLPGQKRIQIVHAVHLLRDLELGGAGGFGLGLLYLEHLGLGQPAAYRL